LEIAMNRTRVALVTQDAKAPRPLSNPKFSLGVAGVLAAKFFAHRTLVPRVMMMATRSKQRV
jgi:hypothetical protein